MIPTPEPTDLHLMLTAWNSGTPAGRDVALQMADLNRERANPTVTRTIERGPNGWRELAKEAEK